MSEYAHLEAVKQATRQRTQSEQGWVRALRDARAQGVTLAAIAAAAGVTRQRVHQITKEA